mmetsp:Transcript_57671/g.135803  ORF Transcript_57671/g.135803 Transcript_57671/m.135803 type:complete len:460 (-) Transcript_57671:536-1915(-)
MRAGIGHGGTRPVVRQELVIGLGAEAELQDLHAGEATAVAQRMDVVGDEAQVLGHDGQRAQGLLDRVEQRHAGAGLPFTTLGIGAVAGDFVVAGKAAEVVDAEDIRLAECALHARRPPGVVLGGHPVPAVQRVAPALAQRPEVIGRHASDDGGLEVVIEVVQVRARPAVGTVVRDEDRQVTHDVHATRVGIGLERPNLHIELPLHELPEPDLVGVLLAGCGEGLGFPALESVGPGPPRLAVERRADGHEEDIVVQPALLCLAPVGEGFAVFGAGPGEEAGRCRAQLLFAPGGDLAIVDLRSREGRHGGLGQPALGDQRLQRHHPLAAGKGRHALVGGVSRADRRGGQQLPQALPGRLQPVDEAVGIGAEIAHAMRAGQRGDVQQHTGGAVVQVHTWRRTTRERAGTLSGWPGRTRGAADSPLLSSTSCQGPLQSRKGSEAGSGLKTIISRGAAAPASRN